MGLRAVSRWCEACRNKASALKLGSRPNLRTDHASFPTLSRPEAIQGSVIEKQKLPYISISYGGESVSQSPLKDKAFSALLDQNPPFELRPEKGVRLIAANHDLQTKDVRIVSGAPKKSGAY
jgi:hypothetical protein